MAVECSCFKGPADSFCLSWHQPHWWLTGKAFCRWGLCALFCLGGALLTLTPDFMHFANAQLRACDFLLFVASSAARDGFLWGKTWSRSIILRYKELGGRGLGKQDKMLWINCCILNQLFHVYAPKMAFPFRMYFSLFSSFSHIYDPLLPDNKKLQRMKPTILLTQRYSLQYPIIWL